MTVERNHLVVIASRLCKGTEGCGICLDVCRSGVLGPAPMLSERGFHCAAVRHPEKCTGCDLCMLFCPDLAVVVTHGEEANHG